MVSHLAILTYITMLANNMNKYDIIKGIGIISVVAGHVFSGAASQVIYIFHMPLFFFLSGYLFNKKPLVAYFEKKAVNLLVPYISYLFLLFFLRLSLGFIKNVLFEGNYDRLGFYLNVFAKAVYGGELLSGVLGVFWFVTCLFFTQQVYNIIVRLPAMKGNVIIMLLYALGVLNSWHKPSLPFPLAFNVTAIALTYYHCGNLFKTHKISDRKILVLIVFTLSIAGALLKTHGIDVGVNMKYTQYGIPILNVVFPLSFIVLIFKVSQFLEPFTYLKIALGRIGQASMTIMFLHQFFYIIICPRIELCENQFITFLISIIGPFIVHFFVSKSPWLNTLLLGDFSKYIELTNRWRQRLTARLT